MLKKLRDYCNQVTHTPNGIMLPNVMDGRDYKSGIDSRGVFHVQIEDTEYPTPFLFRPSLFPQCPRKETPNDTCGFMSIWVNESEMTDVDLKDLELARNIARSHFIFHLWTGIFSNFDDKALENLKTIIENAVNQKEKPDELQEDN